MNRGLSRELRPRGDHLVRVKVRARVRVGVRVGVGVRVRVVVRVRDARLDGSGAEDDLLELVERDLRVSVTVGEGEHSLDGRVVYIRVDLPDGGLKLVDVDLAVAAGVDRHEDSAQLLVSKAAAASALDRRLGGELRPRGDHLIGNGVALFGSCIVPCGSGPQHIVAA